MPVITRKFPRTVGGDTFILLDLKANMEIELAPMSRTGKRWNLVIYTIPLGAKRIDYKLSLRLRVAHIQGSPITVTFHHMALSLRRKNYYVFVESSK